MTERTLIGAPHRAPRRAIVAPSPHRGSASPIGQVGFARAIPICAAIAFAACASAEPKHAPPEVAIDPAAVNALVPPALRRTLVFERRDLVIERGPRKTTYTLAAPRGWIARGTVTARLRPAVETGFLAHVEVSSNCDGECKPKPWEAVADKVNFAPRPQRQIIKDERVPGRRTMIASAEHAGMPTTDVIVAWWTDGARSYHTCKASLGEPLGPAAPAFAAACQAVAIDGDD
jgi:hypothetical protein